MKRLLTMVAACTAVLLLMGPNRSSAQHDDPDMEWETAEAPATGTLFAKMGGQDKITGVVGDFVTLIMADVNLKKSFEKADQTQWKKELTDQITKAAGGETTYKGKTLKDSLAGMGINEEGLMAITKQMAAALDKNRIEKVSGDALLVALELKKMETAQK